MHATNNHSDINLSLKIFADDVPVGKEWATTIEKPEFCSTTDLLCSDQHLLSVLTAFLFIYLKTHFLKAVSISYNNFQFE